MSVLENIMSNIYNNHAKPRETKASGDNAQTVKNAKALSEAAKAEMLTELKSDGKSYVRGTVTDLRQDRVQLKLMTGETINARTESALPLSIGDTADFYVTANDGQLVTLKLAQDSAPTLDSQKLKLLESALQASNIQINDRTLAIANELMEHSQALNAANIRKFMTLSAKFPDTDISNLVLMDINKIPVTRENVDMMNAFNSGTAKLMPELDKALGEIREELSAIRDPEVRTALENELEAVMKEFETGTDHALPTATNEGSGNGSSAAVTDTAIPFESADAALVSENASTASPVPGGGPDLTDANASASNTAGAERTPGTAGTEGFPGAAGADNAANTVSTGNTANTGAPGNTVGTANDPSAPNTSVPSTPNPPVPSASAEANASNASSSGGPVLNNTENKYAPAPEARPSGTSSAGSPEDNSLGRTSANSSDPRAILPGEVSDPEIVKNFYKRLKNVSEKLDNLTDRIREATARQAEATLKEAAEAGGKQPSHASNLNSSLKFMDALNNVFPYLQLPIKLKEENAHGELYVYQKKRALKDGENLSALLHLELDSLGTTDIYVKLNGKNVYTSFSVADDTATKIFTEEMPSLEAALEKKGYSLSSDIKLRDKKEDNAPLLTEFLEAHAPSSVSRFTFDMRA